MRSYIKRRKSLKVANKNTACMQTITQLLTKQNNNNDTGSVSEVSGNFTEGHDDDYDSGDKERK